MTQPKKSRTVAWFCHVLSFGVWLPMRSSDYLLSSPSLSPQAIFKKSCKLRPESRSSKSSTMSLRAKQRLLSWHQSLWFCFAHAASARLPLRADSFGHLRAIEGFRPLRGCHRYAALLGIHWKKPVITNKLKRCKRAGTYQCALSWSRSWWCLRLPVST